MTEQSASVAEPLLDVAQSTQKPKKPRKPKIPTPAEQASAAETLSAVNEQDGRLTAGKKLTKIKRNELISDIRRGLANGMHPTTLKAACMYKFKITAQTVEKYMRDVRVEQLKESGYYKHQIQDMCQKALVEIVQKKRSDTAVIQAVDRLDSMFDIRVQPEDTRETQDAIAQDAIARMNKMNYQELAQFAEQLRNGGDKLTAEMLMPWSDNLDRNETKADRVKRIRRKSQKRHK